MTPVTFTLRPLKDVTGRGPRWMAASDEPWFELKSDRPLAGRCVRLDWSAGLFDPACRLVIRCELGEQNTDIVLGAAAFGRGQWTGRVPQGCQRILLSPMHCAGPFGFRIDRLATLGFAEMMARAFRRRPINAFLSLTARLRGWHQASESELRETFLSTDLKHYDRWRRERLRDVEPDIDGLETAGAAQRVFGVVLELDRFDQAAITDAVEALSRHEHSVWRLFVAVRSGETIGSGGPIDPRVRVLQQATAVEDILSDLPDDALLYVMPPKALLAATLLRQVADAAERHTDAALIYSDEDRYTPDLVRSSPRFKGDFDPLLVATLDLAGATGFWHVRRLKTVLADAVTPADLPNALRLASQTLAPREVVHISRALVSIPAGRESRPQTPPRNKRPQPPSTVKGGPFISVILPTRDRVDLLKPCIESLFRLSRETIEVVIVDNGSCEAGTYAYFEALKCNPSVKILRIDAPFNYSELCNRGVELASSSRLLFLNNDTEFLEPGWEDIIAPHLENAAIGAVGAKLLYGDGRVQHAGIIIGLHGRCGHFEIGMADDDAGYFRRANLPQRTLAVTGACLAVRRDAFEAVNGFDAVHLPVDLNDIDFCLRLTERGFCNLYLPAWRLAHYESATRGQVPESDRIYGRERAYFTGRWLAAIRSDPTFNVNLSLWRTSAALG